MAGNQDQMDQDAIAAQWEASLDSEDPAAAAEEAAANELSESMALQWAAMVEDGGREFGNKNSGERVLSQEEIDNLLGFTVGDVNLDDHSGIRAIIDSAMVSYERLPMLEIVFDRLVRLMTTSLRNFTSDNVEVSLDRITSVRFGDYMNSIPLPAVLSVFKAEEWENFGLATVDSSLIYSIIDVLLGGRRGQTSLRIEGRPYTTIETNLVKRLVKLKVGDTLPLEMKKDALVSVRCGNVVLTEGRMGRVGDRVAIRVTKQLRKPHTTFAMFEKADEQTKLMEAQ